MTHDATRAQIRAARPEASSWVSANAGSGKTRVLTDRVARLLLAGTDPQRILCLTYTKAAAAEMQNRLFRTPGGWAMLEDAPLRAALEALGEPRILGPGELAAARTLFARALETPGGLKIQTIHAFCDMLLRRFPLEAGVAPGFAVLEDRQARALREQVLDRIAESEPAVFAGFAAWLSGDDPDSLLGEIGHNRAAFAGGFEPDRLATSLGIAPGLTLAQIQAATLTAEARDLLAGFIPLLEASGPNDRKLAQAFARALRSEDPGTALESLEDVLLYGDKTKAPFAAKAGDVPTKGLRKAHPARAAALDDLALRVEAARPQRLALAALAKSIAIHRFARLYLAAHAAAKQALGLLDFDDLIARAEVLLARPETAAWVLWRLDGGLDHILVDEAQDTSPAQWRVIEAISADFFAGIGAREVARTIFVVGDEKQSIYSFQGADPAAFGTMRRRYQALIAELGAELQRCDLLYSFRSAAPILRLVDAVFAGPERAGIAGDVIHHAIDPGRPGRVELWPFLPKPDKPEEAPWDTPLDAPPRDDPVRLLAARIAERVRGWLDAGLALPGSGRPIQAGDVLILVQRRNEIFNAVIRALKAARVPVAGADLLRLGGELAVKDLLAVLRVVATPSDDLSLAAFLRSPLGAMTEGELFELAQPRAGSLIAALEAAPPERWAPCRALIADLRAQADYLRPFELLERILVRHAGRRMLVARLGTEAEDGIDALLDQALAYEGVEAPSLTGFLAWIDRDEMAVKRRLDDSADQVRVMTVHGAKGLEAPIVILPDTAARSEAANPPQLLRLADGTAAWRTRADAAPLALAEAEARRRAAVRAENQRLLYVALTRPQSWLILCGAGPAPKEEDDSWYRLVEAALGTFGPAGGPEGERILEQGWIPAGVPAGMPAAPAVLPPWAGLPPPVPAADGPRLVAPSGLGGGHVLAGDALLPEADVLARGTAIHRLLEHLPGVPAADWPRLAEHLLPDTPDRAELMAEVAGVLADPHLAELLASGSLAEVDVTADLPGGARLLGRIDRLVVAPEGLLAIDFKSNRTVPDRPEEVPEGILRQMGAYRSALAAIWPGRRIETAILWTRRPLLMPLPGELVAAALARRGIAPEE